MPQSKEEKAEYDRAYNVANREKIAEYARAYRLAHKEERAEYKKAYRLAHREEQAEYARTYHRENHEEQMIKGWRRQGHFIPEGTEHGAYVRFRDTTHCEFCGWELVEGGYAKSNTKVRHHDHDIEGQDNFIGIICQICNVREKCTNTSGEPNVYYIQRKKTWAFSIMCFGKKYQKGSFKTFEEALTHKGAWFALNSPQAFHDPEWICELP